MIGIIGNSRRPDITFYRDGRIDIAARVAKTISLHPGDVIDITIHSAEYLLYVSHRHHNTVGRHEGQCRPTQKGSNNFRTYSKRLCDFILRQSGADNIARLCCGEPLELNNQTIGIPIITKNKLTKKEHHD